MTMTSQSPFAAFVGIDWADRLHAVYCVDAGGSSPRARTLEQKADAIDSWVAELRRQYAGRPVAVCLEQSRGALVYALMKYDCLVLFPINPKQLARYREALSPSGAKDDPTDAELLCRFLREHQSHLRAWQPDDSTTRGLRLLTEQRRAVVAQRTAAGNRLSQMLKECYPLALEFAGTRVYSSQFLKLLEMFPTQGELQRATPNQLQRYLPKQRRVADDPPADVWQAERVARIRTAQPLVTDEAVLNCSRLAVQYLVDVLQTLKQAIAAHDAEIARLLPQHPDASLFGDLPGAGAALTPRLVAAFGSDRSRYASAAELQQLSGIAPVLRRSGKTSSVHSRHACPKFIKQTFHEFARCSRAKSAWARAYLAMLRARGQGFQAAVRALAFKWLRILFACWKSRQPYDEARYLKQLRAKNSPLLAFLDPENNPVA